LLLLSVVSRRLLFPVDHVMQLLLLFSSVVVGSPLLPIITNSSMLSMLLLRVEHWPRNS
jgi:hypothetical protein